MPSKKALSADNQQERLDLKSWLVGFVDGEGSFLVSIFRNQTTKLGWQVFPEFIITQGEKSLRALEEVRNFFGCGHIFVNRRFDNHHEDVYRFCVRSMGDLREKIVPFFDHYRLRTAKSEDFKKFKKVLELMNKSHHLKKSGQARIRRIAETMNRKGMANR